MPSWLGGDSRLVENAFDVERDTVVSGGDRSSAGRAELPPGRAVVGGAAAIDFVRTEKLPKDLRDDYTAISLSYIGYVMLHTTALTLHDADTAEIAGAHLADYAQSMMALQRIIPAATVAFLASEGFDVDASVLPAVENTIKASWD